jgi:hypothetical protein
VFNNVHRKKNPKNPPFNSTTQRGPNKLIKTFQFEDFFHLPPVSTTATTPMVHLEVRISPRIFEKIWNGCNGILRSLEETGSRKKPEVEILVALGQFKLPQIQDLIQSASVPGKDRSLMPGLIIIKVMTSPVHV